jgi:hypothetical protein
MDNWALRVGDGREGEERTGQGGGGRGLGTGTNKRASKST